MIDIDETEKQVKLLQSKNFIRMQLDLPEVLELIERVRQAEARIAELEEALTEECRQLARATVHTAAAMGTMRLTMGEEMVKLGHEGLREKLSSAEARIAEVEKLHQPESFHDEPIESFCKTCQRTSGVWPCGTAIALGLNEGENTDV